MNKKSIYLDYAANTPVDKEVLEVFNDNTLKYFANPNSTHSLGVETNKKIEEGTKKIMQMLQTEAKLDNDMEIVYTSGSSESNIVILAAAKLKNIKKRQKVVDTEVISV